MSNGRTRHDIANVCRAIEEGSVCVTITRRSSPQSPKPLCSCNCRRGRRCNGCSNICAGCCCNAGCGNTQLLRLRLADICIFAACNNCAHYTVNSTTCNLRSVIAKILAANGCSDDCTAYLRPPCRQTNYCNVTDGKFTLATGN